MTLTIENLRALAEQLESDARAVRKILDAAECSDITPAQAKSMLRKLGIAITP